MRNSYFHYLTLWATENKIQILKNYCTFWLFTIVIPTDKDLLFHMVSLNLCFYGKKRLEKCSAIIYQRSGCLSWCHQHVVEECLPDLFLIPVLIYISLLCFMFPLCSRLQFIAFIVFKSFDWIWLAINCFYPPILRWVLILLL